MTDFILKQRQKEDTDNVRRFWACERYAKFIKQPLELWMFVPCKLVDGVWEILDFPILKGIPRNASFNSKYQNDCFEYQQAKERCIFNGFNYEDVKEMLSCNSHKVVEDIIKYDVQLTATAQKQMGL